MLEKYLKEKNMSVYKCAILSGLPYTTVLEIVKGKTTLSKCSVETVYKISKTLNIPVGQLIEESMEYRIAFEEFKSNICHMVKDLGDIDFIIKQLKDDNIRKYWNKKWYPEAFYTLAMVDYLSKENQIPLSNRYEDIRSSSLKEPIYPRDFVLMKNMGFDSEMIKKFSTNAIPEFLKYNIIEADIRNVY